MKKIKIVILILGTLIIFFITIKFVVDKNIEKQAIEMELKNNVDSGETNEFLDSLIEDSLKNIKIGVYVEDEIIDIDSEKNK